MRCCSSRRAIRNLRARRSRSSGSPLDSRSTSSSRPPTPCSESRRITAGQKLEVVARVALGGTPTATSGDPFGQVSYHVGQRRTTEHRHRSTRAVTSAGGSPHAGQAFARVRARARHLVDVSEDHGVAKARRSCPKAAKCRASSRASRRSTIDRKHLAAYSEICGAAAGATLPIAYPHILAMPLHLAMLGAEAFPVKLFGLVHVQNRIAMREPLSADEPAEIRCWIEGHRETERGQEFDLHTEYVVGGQPRWDETCTFLARKRARRGRRRRPRTVSAQRGGRPDAVAMKSSSFRAPSGLGRRYGFISGDVNPIHMSDLTARAFGFPRAIAHGMWSLGRLASDFEPAQFDGGCELTVSFKLPIYMPAWLMLQRWDDRERQRRSRCVTRRARSRISRDAEVAAVTTQRADEPGYGREERRALLLRGRRAVSACCAAITCCARCARRSRSKSASQYNSVLFSTVLVCSGGAAARLLVAGGPHAARPAAVAGVDVRSSLVFLALAPGLHAGRRGTALLAFVYFVALTSANFYSDRGLLERDGGRLASRARQAFLRLCRRGRQCRRHRSGRRWCRPRRARSRTGAAHHPRLRVHPGRRRRLRRTRARTLRRCAGRRDGARWRDSGRRPRARRPRAAGPTSPYLLGIAGMLVAGQIIGAFMYNEQGKYVAATLLVASRSRGAVRAHWNSA